MPSNRIDRIHAEIHRELAGLLRTVKDPRVQGLVSIGRVETTADLRYAKVYVSVLDPRGDARGMLEGLRSAAGYLRREIGQAIRLRYTPELVFELDSSISRGSRILDILGRLREENRDADNR
jgi:ribosome-binding factor A